MRVRPLGARDRLEREHDNLRAALAWALASSDAETAQRLGAELARFWVVLGYIPEGRDWLEQAVALDAPSSPATRVDALLWAANFAASQDALVRADVLAEDALALARASGYRRGSPSRCTSARRRRCGGATTSGRRRCTRLHWPCSGSWPNRSGRE